MDNKELENNSPLEKRQELAQQFYREGGWEETKIEPHLQGTNFAEEVNHKNLETGTLLASYQTRESYEKGIQGNYYAELNDNLNRRQLGIENDSPETQNRELQIYRVNQDISALESTANKIEDWNGSGEIFTGGGKQLCIPHQDKEALSVEFPAHILYPVPINQIENQTSSESQTTSEKVPETGLIPLESPETISQPEVPQEAPRETGLIPLESSLPESQTETDTQPNENSSVENTSETSSQIY